MALGIVNHGIIVHETEPHWHFTIPWIEMMTCDAVDSTVLSMLCVSNSVKNIKKASQYRKWKKSPVKYSNSKSLSKCKHATGSVGGSRTPAVTRHDHFLNWLPWSKNTCTSRQLLVNCIWAFSTFVPCFHRCGSNSYPRRARIDVRCSRGACQ